MPGAADRPNILVIHTDQHRWDCLGAYGNRQIKTPNIDALAADGTRFDHSFCPYPVCTPSRYSLLSGLYVRQHAGWTNRSTLAPGIATFPRMLREAGYKTKAVGKMHFTPTYLDVGFEEMELAEQDGPGRMDDDYHRELRANDLMDAIDVIDQRREFRDRAPKEYWATCGAMVSDLPEKWHSTTWIGDRAVRTLEGWGDGGNLLMAGFIKPHHPFDPPDPWHKMYDPDSTELRPGWTDSVAAHDLALNRGYFPHDKLTRDVLQRVTAYYYATISQIDHHVGRMVEMLKRRGVYDKTLIVFTSDHGEYLGYHHLLLKGGHMYEPLIRVPLIIKWPGGARKGSVRDALVTNIDLAPTILRRAGLEPARGMKGLDLAQPTADRPMVFAESGRGHMIMARSKTHKLLYAPRRNRRLFYDLRDDPTEMTNRVDDAGCQAEIARHEAAIARWSAYDATPPIYVDHCAPCVGQPRPQRPKVEDGREQMLDYFEKKTKEYLRSRAQSKRA